MNVLLRTLAVLLPIFLPAAAPADEEPTGNLHVEITTNLGSFVIQLWPEEAPVTVANFLSYVDSDFYQGLIFHRVIPNFMVQVGGYDAELKLRDPGNPIANESIGGERNLRSTIAMARTADPDSATAQFFINVKDNQHLDAAGQRPGYAVFGQVISGMDVIDRISLVRTGVRNGMADVPLETIIIESAKRHDS